MLNFEGHPRVDVEVNDVSILATNSKRSIACVMGVTQRGKPGVPVFVANWIQFRRKLGGYHSASNFPLYCERLLNGGAQLWVVPLAHYSDIEDSTSATGTRAAGTITVVGGGGAGVATFTAKGASEGYNGLIITVVAARSGLANKVDIRISVPNITDATENFYDVPQVPTDPEKTALNTRMVNVDLTSFTTRIPLGTATLTGGVQTAGDIIDADYIGDKVAKTGWYAFDRVTNAQYIANIDRPVPVVDAALALYCTNRNDVRFFIRTPIGLTSEGMTDYRLGTGLYSHTPIDTYLGNLIAGDITITNPLDTTQSLEVSSIADAVAARCLADGDNNYGPWFALAGERRGKIQNSVGILYNLGSPALIDEANAVAKAGMIYAIDHPKFGQVFWNDSSLLRDKSKLLSNESIANLAMYIKRRLPEYVERELFEPNDPQTWGAIYRNTLPFITELENGRAIRAGENVNWYWYGDQNATDLSQLVYNTEADVDAGIYRVKFLFKPINSIKFIGIEATLSDSKSFQYNVITA